MYITRLTPIDWRSSMDRLSIGAFYLLNILYRYDVEINDEALMSISNQGVSTHRKYKKELIDSGYLEVEQTGKASYQYSIKDSNGN